MVAGEGARVAVRWTQESDLPILKEFLSRHYPPGHALRDDAYFSFWFRRPGEPIGVILALLGSAIIGIQGIIRNRLYWRGATYPAAWYCNTFVAGEFRNRGIGLRLLAFSKAQLPNLLTLSYTPEAGALLKRLGFSFYGGASLRRYWCLLDARAFGRLPNAGAVPEGATELVTQGGPQPKRVIKPDNALAEAWVASAESYGLGTARDVEWLRSRYFGHPSYEYHVITADSTRGCCVIRLEPTARGPMAARVVDYWGEPEDIPTVLAAGAVYAKEAGAPFVDFYASSPVLEAKVGHAGFFRLDGSDAWEVPYLFNPPVRRQRYHEGFAALLSEVPGGGPTSAAELHFVKADGDRDR